MFLWICEPIKRHFSVSMLTKLIHRLIHTLFKVGDFSSRVMLILCKFLHGESSSYSQWVYTHTWANILTALFRLWKLFSCVSHTTVQVVITTVIPVVYDVWIMMFAISINNSTMYVYWIIHSMNIWK